MPECAVHVDVLPHCLQDGVLRGVPVEVGLLLVDVVQFSNGLGHGRVQSSQREVQIIFAIISFSFSSTLFFVQDGIFPLIVVFFSTSLFYFICKVCLR